MKVLIITEKQDLSTKISTIAKNYGADTIIYKWFLKALDNLEEIQPDVIILSTSEYPRLWKTLVQFLKSGLGGPNPRTYLYKDIPLSEEDQEKYEELGISGYFTQINENSLSFLNTNAPLPVIGEVLFSMPQDGKIISGMINAVNKNELKCTLDFAEDFTGVEKIPNLNVRLENHIKNCSARVKQFDKFKNSLILEVQ